MRKRGIRINWSVIVIFMIASCIFILTKCIDKKSAEGEEVETQVAISQFAGSEKCAGCHKDIYQEHIETGHFRTTRPAVERDIRGSFATGKNTYTYNPSLYVAMEKRDSGLFQVVYYQGVEKKALRFDIVIGSGTRGQSYMYWLGNRLFQMPITYFAMADQWANSPGFPDKVQIDRPITSRCLECHSTFMKTISPPGSKYEHFDHNQVIYGIGCEKCHGPGAAHIAFQTKNPGETKGRYIINPTGFSREQNLNLCALCHGGRLEKTKPSFSFTAGKSLADYFIIDTVRRNAINDENVDVHGNQDGLLRASRCFQQSLTMTCNTCHDPHRKESDNMVLFSKRCLSCHTAGGGNFCTLRHTTASFLQQNCIDCHMPEKLSKTIVLSLSGQEIPKAMPFRSHLIGIYPGETKKYMDAHAPQ